jgi:hypothetical protein
MPKEILQDIVDEYTIGGQTIQVPAGEVVRATPTNGMPEYIRLQFASGESYLWNAPLDDWSEAVSEDDPRWVREQ